MAAIQTRRSISVGIPTYDNISKHAEDNGLSRSGIVEKVVNEFLDKAEAKATRELKLNRTKVNLEVRRSD